MVPMLHVTAPTVAVQPGGSAAGVPPWEPAGSAGVPAAVRVVGPTPEFATHPPASIVAPVIILAPPSSLVSVAVVAPPLQHVVPAGGR